MIKGLVISGEFGKIIAREKSGNNFELGELLIADTKDAKVMLQVYDLVYGSQISQQNLELAAGLNLEEDSNTRFLDSRMRNYNLALLKNLVTIKENTIVSSKTLPAFFSNLRKVTSKDLKFLTTPKNPLFLGNLRSGSEVLDININLEGDKALSHHVLISGTTGRGKSVLVSNILWSILANDYCGMLVLDPHDEYYGRNTIGMKDHPKKTRVVYYTPKNAPPGTKTLKINLNSIKPAHFNGVVDWSDPQQQALTAFYREYGDSWINALLLDKPFPSNINFMEGTINVVKRRIMAILSLSVSEEEISCEGIFTKDAGESTIKDIAKELESRKIVIVDTSLFSGETEILIGSMISSELLSNYKHYKTKGTLKEKPVISIILEEAPRVLGKEVLERGQNIFSTIAREGRKFKIGLVAITQLPSLIPRQILANMNTKIILGIEMKPERQAIIESASQDLSSDDRNIASLDKGEALITSSFVKFATPVKVPWFEDIARKDIEASKSIEKNTRTDFSGIKLS